MTDKVFPCIDCLIYPLCKATFSKCATGSSAILKLLDKCELLCTFMTVESYPNPSNHVYYNPSRIRNTINFFEERIETYEGNEDYNKELYVSLKVNK